MCEYFGDVPVDVQNKFKKDPSEYYILENLKTHDSNLLVRKIQERFPKFEIDDISMYTKDKIKYIRLFISYDKTTKDDVYAFVNSKKLLNFCIFMVWPPMIGLTAGIGLVKSRGVIIFIRLIC